MFKSRQGIREADLGTEAQPLSVKRLKSNPEPDKCGHQLPVYEFFYSLTKRIEPKSLTWGSANQKP